MTMFTGENSPVNYRCLTYDVKIALLMIIIAFSGFTKAEHNEAAKKYSKETNLHKATQPSDGMASMQTQNADMKSRDHIDKTLKLKDFAESRKTSAAKERIMTETVQNLAKLYKTDIKPLEDAYRYGDLSNDALLEAEITAKPLILFVGPWSTGKTSLINYLLGIEDTQQQLRTGAEPTTADFFIIQHGMKYRTVKGMQLVTDPSKAFASLEKLGQGFIEKLQGVEMPSPLLELVTLVDTPGILENKKQQERGYPFNETIQWFLQRASLIFLLFDPTKLEVGSELESVFKQLKGHEASVKILLNKADMINPQELMRVYGTLFWSLAPLVNSVEPPRVYVGSFWSKAKADHPMAKLFQDEELSLLNDLDQAIENQVENKITFVRRHAFMVRLHALVVDSFIRTFRTQSGYFTDNDIVWERILNNPRKFAVFESVLQVKQNDISKHDLPEAETYIEFFKTNPIDSFLPLKKHCPYFSDCLEDQVATVISTKLPKLLNTLQSHIKSGFCTKQVCN